MTNNDYENLLDEIYLNLPNKAKTHDRFEPPGLIVFQQGSKTIIKNYSVIFTALRRDEQFLTKYLTKELATPAEYQNQRLIIHSKINQRLIEDKYELFIKKYVICLICNRPDTKIVNDKEHGVKLLECEACGARSPIK